MKIPDEQLDKPTPSFFVVEAGAFAMVYTLRGEVLKAWFVPRPDGKEVDERDNV